MIDFLNLPHLWISDIHVTKVLIYSQKMPWNSKKLKIFTKLFSGLQTPSEVKPRLFIVISTSENTNIKFIKKCDSPIPLLLAYVNFSFWLDFLTVNMRFFWSEYQISASEVGSKNRSKKKNSFFIFFLEVLPDKSQLFAKQSDHYRLL